MIIWLTFLGLTISQILVAKLLAGRLPRLLLWLIVLSALFCIHWMNLDESGLLRMVWLCSVLLAGMKAVVYREWCVAKNTELSWGRWLLFTFLWFGMDPSPFVSKRKVEWRSHALIGSLCLLGGLTGIYICYLLDIRSVVVLFICMSASFHFGVLRLMTAFWRWQSFPVRVLFRNPIMMRGFRDFWGKRWNLAYSQMMARVVKKPLTPLLGEKMSLFTVFLVSGLLHELAITVPVGAGYGWPTAFFVLHGFICLLEKKESVLMGALCGLVLVLGLPYLFNEKFVDEIIIPSRNVLEYIK